MTVQHRTGRPRERNPQEPSAGLRRSSTEVRRRRPVPKPPPGCTDERMRWGRLWPPSGSRRRVTVSSAGGSALFEEAATIPVSATATPLRRVLALAIATPTGHRGWSSGPTGPRPRKWASRRGRRPGASR